MVGIAQDIDEKDARFLQHPSHDRHHFFCDQVLWRRSQPLAKERPVFSGKFSSRLRLLSASASEALAEPGPGLSKKAGLFTFDAKFSSRQPKQEIRSSRRRKAIRSRSKIAFSLVWADMGFIFSFEHSPLERLSDRAVPVFNKIAGTALFVLSIRPTQNRFTLFAGNALDAGTGAWPDDRPHQTLLHFAAYIMGKHASAVVMECFRASLYRAAMVDVIIYTAVSACDRPFCTAPHIAHGQRRFWPERACRVQ